MKQKVNYSWLGSLLLILLSVVCLLVVVVRNEQAVLSFPIQQRFLGEYSRNGITWHPLRSDTELSALDGDLILRGHFSYDIGEGGRLYYYQNHIGVTFYRNGTLLQGDTVSEFAREGWALQPSMCGSGWSFLFSPGITTEDTVEIHLHDPHSHGNASAYRDFLNTLYNSPNTPYILEAYLRPYSMPFQIAGAVYHRRADAAGRGAGLGRAAHPDGRRNRQIRPACAVYGRLRDTGQCGYLLPQRAGGVQHLRAAALHDAGCLLHGHVHP
ncbi:MAG: hypothetical protein MR935_08495 [Agathobaculum sp.]|uniref:hypothetical protein n=1 Tax=Agathobaculum sp. TaxID=2048138 RepID=UPI0025C01BED|nr:hypothetical protein [Agathobaculum sp.]MCI7126213.1 hypothetical protein [Agathobaculum sp.]MDY3712147.1 hypothetical protein [Agathobaculum sp.]